MADQAQKLTIFERLDALYEFDHEPFTEDKLQSGWFVGVSLWLMPLMARKKPEAS